MIERLRRRVEEFKAKRAAGQVEPVGIRIKRRIEEIRARRQAMRSPAKSESPVIEPPAVKTYETTSSPSPIVEIPKIRTY